MKSAFTVEHPAATPETRDRRIPPRDQVVTRAALEKWNHECPDKVWAKFADNGEEWTYAQFHEKTVQMALGLQQLGVQQGEHVLVWLPNGRENLLAFFAINYLGAVYVSINTAYKGQLLAHVVENSDARLAIVHSDLAPRFADIKLAKLTDAVMVGERIPCPGLKTHYYDDVLVPKSGTLKAPERVIEPWDPMAIIYTSGTTGPSKGVLASYLHIWSNMGPETWHNVHGDDRYMINMPMFHIGGSGIVYAMLMRGGSIAFTERFNTSTFLAEARSTGSTVVFLLGVMAGFLEKLEAKLDDADNPLRVAFMVPLAGDIQAFSKRFGLDVYTIFNMTEISTPIFSDPNPLKRGTCGLKRPGVDVRLVDDNDCEVPIGAIGEMMVRTDRPWGMNSGYYKNPEATARAWRNGWFHTGDAFRKDEDGYFYFVDRMKDAIRRRGENISSFEVEAEVVAYPDIQEVAAIGVPNELSEDDVMVVVAPIAGRTVDPVALIEFLRPRMAHFMIPRYVRIVDELPKTPTTKVQKAELRKQGITPDTWDREKAGIKIKIDRFSGSGRAAE
jgi:crotonobetaine/carnitine-CoA ligase